MKTLQDKIDGIMKEFDRGFEGGYPLQGNIDKAIQELREEIQFRFIWKDCKYCQDAKDILALIGEKK